MEKIKNFILSLLVKSLDFAQGLRRNKKSFIVSLICFIVLFALCVGGLISYFTSDDLWIAKVNGEEIEVRDLEQKIERFISRSDIYITKSEAKEYVLKDLILGKILDLEAQKYGINITEDTILEIVKKEKLFQTNGIFDENLLLEFLQKQNLSENEYYAMIKNNLISDITMSFIANINTDDKKLAENIYISRNEERIFDMYVFNESSISVNPDLSEESIARYYNDNRDKFTSSGKVLYKEISGKDIFDKINYIPSNDEIDYISKSLYKMSKKQIKDNISYYRKCDKMKQMLQNINKISIDEISKANSIKVNTSTEVITLASVWPKLEEVQYFKNGKECYQFTLRSPFKIEEPRYIPYKEAHSMIISSIKADKKSLFAIKVMEDLKDRLNKMPYNDAIFELKKLGFSSFLNKKIIRKNKVIKDFNIADDVLSSIFMTDVGYFSSPKSFEGKHYIFFIKNKNFNSVKNQNEIDAIASEISYLKKYDARELYFDDLHNKYDVQINAKYMS